MNEIEVSFVNWRDELDDSNTPRFLFLGDVCRFQIILARALTQDLLWSPPHEKANGGQFAPSPSSNNDVYAKGWWLVIVAESLLHAKLVIMLLLLMAKTPLNETVQRTSVDEWVPAFTHMGS